MNIHSPQNPYVGLRPFDVEENLIFFGRQEETQSLLEKLHQHRFVAVIGNSGTGKSSLIRAGLIPKLLAGFLVRDRDRWQTGTFRPGSTPLENLGLALGQLRTDKALEIKETFVHEVRESGPDTAIPLVRSYLHDDETNLLILVDQFEELFRYGVEFDADKSAEEAELFVSSLLALAKQQSVPAYIVITMRSDFLGDCAAFPDLSEAINRSVFLVPQMRPLQALKAIEAPLRLCGGSISLRLHERIAEDLRAHPADQLPVLQHALHRTWARWQDEGRGEGQLDLPDYEAIGSMAHALDQHSEKAYQELVDERQRKICEKIFKALTDKSTDPRGIRRPTRLGVLCGLAEASQSEVTEVIDVFRKPSRSFLVPPLPDELAKDTVIDISHESLMRVWERLTAWTDEEVESARLFRRIFDTANLHADGKAGLWDDPDLEFGLEWWNKEKPTEIWARLYGGDLSQAKDFLMKSQRLRDAEVLEKEESQKHARRTAWTLRVALFVAGVLLGALLMLIFR